MRAALTYSRSLGILRVRPAFFARAPLKGPCFTFGNFEPRLPGLLTPRNLPHLKDTVRSLTTTAGVRPAMAQRSEEDLDRYRPGGYHPVHLGDLFNDRYVVTANADHPGYKHVVCLLDEFRHAGPHGVHVCLVFEVMGEDLVALGRRYCDQKLPVHLVKQVARQLLLGLDYLHRSCKVVHTDVQPRNIMIQLDNAESVIRDHLERRPHEPSGSDEIRRPAAYYFNSEALTTEIPHSTSDINIKIVDFGVASWVDNHLTELIQPTSLRAPEVILRANWGPGADIWSAACVIFELLQGRVLFKGRPDPNGAWTAEEDHLAQMMELLGPLPTDLLAEGRSSGSFFDKDGTLKVHLLSLGGYADPAAIAIRVRQVICYISIKYIPLPLSE
ncbi:MAG: hypothetical protein Q9204_002683 [Flavoplaca sp. TL-2023a]